MTEAPESAGPRTGCAPGTPCWVSLLAHAPVAAEEFYGALFGWEFRPGPLRTGRGVPALLDGREVACIGQLPPDQRLQVAWTPYLASDDVDLTAEQVRLCGGTVAVGPLDAAGTVPGDPTGRTAVAADTAGAVFGLCHGSAHPGPAPDGLPGTPVWNELRTVETVGVATFYATVFGYTEETPAPGGPDYLTLHSAGRPVAALHGMGRALPRGRGSHWLTHFRVADTGAALRRVVELGGQVLQPEHTAPHGRVALVADPEGARFVVVQSGS